MSVLAIYPESGSEPAEVINDSNKISKILEGIQVKFEKWKAGAELPEKATQVEILAAYEEQVNKLKEKYNFQSADVVSLSPSHPDKDTLRKKFLNEHTHTDFEVRFFVEGSGLFFLHADKMIYAVFCQKGDLISVPADTPHWFDMGSDPDFKCIRLFTDPAGWIGHFTGSSIAENFPDFDTFSDSYNND
jgi:1,2-dihydroxy-3-keto-5-methylthiopentene dioxygenase